MYSSIYRVQSSIRRLPIQALFGFTLKLVESYLFPSSSEPLVWWFVLSLPWVTSTSYCVLWCLFKWLLQLFPFMVDQVICDFCGFCVTVFFFVCFVCRLKTFIPSVFSLQSLILSTRSILCSFSSQFSLWYWAQECSIVVYLNSWKRPSQQLPFSLTISLVLWLLLRPTLWTMWSPVSSPSLVPMARFGQLPSIPAHWPHLSWTTTHMMLILGVCAPLIALCNTFLVITSAVSFQGWSDDLWLLCYTVSLCLVCL